MPRRRRSIRRRVAAGLTREQAHCLLHGFRIVGPQHVPPEWGQRIDPDAAYHGTLRESFVEAARETWEAHRDELLLAWIAVAPLSRPDAWWLFDAPEPERRLVRGPDPRRRHPEFFKMPRYMAWSRGVPTAIFWGTDAPPGPVWETEGAYLERLNLLTSEERALVETCRARGEPLPRCRGLDIEATRDALELLGFDPPSWQAPLPPPEDGEVYADPADVDATAPAETDADDEGEWS